MSGPATAPAGGGHIKDAFDPRDHYYVPNPDTVAPQHVNLRQDDAQLVSDIYDQLHSGSCTANATAAAFWYEEKAGRQDQVWGSAGPSRLFIYWLARGAYLSPYYEIWRARDSGCSPREAMKGIAKVGACSEVDWPFNLDNINQQPPKETFVNASPTKITAFYRLDPDRPDADDHKLTTEQKDKIGAALLDKLRKCLAEQYPVVFGFWYYLPTKQSFDETQTPFVMKDVWNLPDKKFPRHTFPDDLPDDLRIRDGDGEPVTLGHTVLAIGYDDERQQILVQNSWGPLWSGGGTFWMPYSWVLDFAASNDFWTIRTSQGGLATKPTLWQDVHREVLQT